MILVDSNIPMYVVGSPDLGVNRPCIRVGYTDGEKGDSFPKGQEFDTVFGAGGRA